MTIAEMSQYNPDNVTKLMYGDPEIFQAMDMAASNDLISELQNQGLELTTDADSMAELRKRLDIPSEIGVGITVIRSSDAAEAMPDGVGFLNDSPTSIGFCFSAGIENNGRDVLELFVAIDASNYPETEEDDEPTDEQAETILELNQYIITQILIGLDGDESDDEPSDEVFAALEEKASTIMEDMFNAEFPPILALVGSRDED